MLLFTIPTLCLLIAVWCKAKADKMVVDFINLPFANQQKVRSKWFCFNPLAKYKNGKYGTGYKTWTIPILKIKTSFLVTNFSDGWHFVNSLGIFAMLLPIALLIAIATHIYTPLAVIAIYTAIGIIWNWIFEFIY